MVLAFNACAFTNHFLRHSEADVWLSTSHTCMIGHDPVLVSFLRYSSDKHYTSLTFHDWTSWFVMSRHHDYHSSQLQGYHHISSGV